MLPNRCPGNDQGLSVRGCVAAARQCFDERIRPITDSSEWVPSKKAIRFSDERAMVQQTLVTGATGFIGRKLVKKLQAPLACSRNRESAQKATRVVRRRRVGLGTTNRTARSGRPKYRYRNQSDGRSGRRSLEGSQEKNRFAIVVLSGRGI